MLRDVFYYGAKPNVHPREQYAESFDDARKKCTTEHFWIINEFCDYRGFDWDWDFEFLPDEDVWAEQHTNIWPSQHQKDSGTWLCSCEEYDLNLLIYRGDVNPVKRKNIKTSNWAELDLIDPMKFDFSWHPDPTEPPYIYKWGSKYAPVQFKTCLEYHVEGATTEKYMGNIVELLPETDRWIEHQAIDKSKFDMSWRPDPMDPPLNYIWGNKWVDGKTSPTLEYRVPDAVDTKFMHELVTLASSYSKFELLEAIDESAFDFTWMPNPTSPPYIYVWGNQWNSPEDKISVQYVVKGATEYKYMEERVTRKPDLSNWQIRKGVDVSKFDFSWEPSPADEPYIYEFGTQWQKTGGPRYIVKGAISVKYIDTMTATSMPNDKSFVTMRGMKIKTFDYSWHPDSTEHPYIYVFGNQWYSAEIEPTIEYRMPDAVEKKYVTDILATVEPNYENWITPDHVDISTFDYSWHPTPGAPPYIYEFGTQWQKTGGPRYIVEDATERKFINDIPVTRKSTYQRWTIPDNIDTNSFDFSWHPDDTDPAYIYVFGTQWATSGGPTYTVNGATETKYVDVQVATAIPTKTNWKYDPTVVDEGQFDFSWHPDPREPAYVYVWGNKYEDGKYKSTIEYHADGATDIKYMTNDIIVLPEWNKWVEVQAVDKTMFDFTWRPDPLEPPYIYTWGNKHIDAALKPTLEYHCAAATERKYVSNDIIVLPEFDRWLEIQAIDKTKFDMSWRPDPREPPYIYTWGNKYEPAEITPTLQYKCVGATEVKYMDELLEVDAQWDRWVFLKDVDKSSFDFSWRPDPLEPPYIYTWGNKYEPAEIAPTLQYKCVGATEVKYMDEHIAVLPEWNRWEIPSNINRNKFDFSWRPDPREPAFIYKFATVWNSRGGPVYTVPGAAEIKYIEDIKAGLLQSKNNWDTNNVDTSTFDFSWVPHPEAPPYIYQFGTLEDANDGPRYVTPNNIGEIVKLRRVTLVHEEEQVVAQYYIETTLDDLVKQHPDELFWAKHKNIDYSSFDFDWRPEMVEISYQLDYVHVFGSPESELTQTYFVSGKNYLAGKTSFNFIEIDTKLDDKTLFKIFKKSDMFYVDRGNAEAQSRFEALKRLYPQIQKTRYLNSWVDTINRCTNRSTTDLFWVLNSELDYNGFDFEYYPNPWQMKMVQVFGTQWSHWGTTFMVNRESFSDDTKYIKIIEHLSNINFVKNIKAKATQCVYDAIIIDHDNRELEKVVAQVTKKTSGKNVTVVKYNTSYLQTLKDIVSKLVDKKEHFLWLCSSICDYSTFDFSYVCDPFAKDNLHVFPSGTQKFGDTFLIDVNKTKEIIADMEVLEDYHKVNYNNTQRVARLPEPIIVTSNDTQIEAAMRIEGFPYATIISSDNKNISVIDNEPMNLWAPETKTILVTSTGATRITVPREVKDHVKKELYDYPYIKKASKLAISSPMDIVYLSNGETGAEENWEHLQKITQGLKNRLVRVDGVNGRVQAYHAALEASETPWAFTVFAKLKISPKFDFNWQPDRMQVAKHYVFHAKNPVNGLIYGHQAMIAYNKKLTLANSGKGLDFTLDDEHEVVPLLSGIANYNTDEFSTWRTAFREVLKLKAEDSEVARQRLDAWLNKATGDYFQYSIKGAIDADEYYDEVDGDFEMLKLSYEWAWLKERFANS